MALSLNLCLSCNDDFYPMENDPLNNGDYINCYNEKEGYYLDLDNNNSLFKKCYYTCETCEINGDNITHNCLKCNSNYSFKIKNDSNNYSNCYNSLDINFIKYFEGSNYTTEEINKKIYEQIIDYIENFDISEKEEKIIEGKGNYSFHLTTLDKELDIIEGKNNNSNK